MLKICSYLVYMPSYKHIRFWTAILNFEFLIASALVNIDLRHVNHIRYNIIIIYYYYLSNSLFGSTNTKIPRYSLGVENLQLACIHAE